MGTKAEEMALLAQGKGCLAKAADDELIFIFRSQDKLYTLPVMAWADELASIHGNDHPKVVEAYQNIERARAWQAANQSKVKYPD